MKHAHFIRQIDETRIRAAITSADAATTGTVHLFVSKRHCADPITAAERHFRALRLDRRPGRNAILIFVAPSSRTFAIYGDTEVHRRAGDIAWAAVREKMGALFREARFTDALVHAITTAGELLATHFPE